MSRHVGQDMDDVIRVTDTQGCYEKEQTELYSMCKQLDNYSTCIFKFLKVMEVCATIQTANLSHRPISTNINSYSNQ